MAIDYQAAYGKRPDKIGQERVDIDAEQLAAIKANKAALDPAKALSEDASKAELGTLIARLEQALPGYSAMKGKGTQIIDDMLNARVGQDVWDNIRGKAASDLIGGKFGGAGMANMNSLKTLGLTSLDMQQKGLAAYGVEADRAAGLAQKTQMPLTSMFINPDKRLEVQQVQANNKMEIDSFNAGLQSMPDAGAVAQIDTARMAAVGGLGTQGATRGRGGPAYNGSHILSGNFQAARSGMTDGARAILGGYNAA
jgi:hypothetical protein